MDSPDLGFEFARTMMVDGQVRPNKVTDARIINAMRELPRERFVPLSLAPLAYADVEVKLGRGRVMAPPMAIARLVQLAGLRRGETVLLVGAGTGYGAALLAACGARVTALEEDAELIALARTALAGVDGITLVTGPLAEGWKQAAPYDVLFIEGAVEDIPAALSAQLRSPGGRLVAVRDAAGRVSQAVLGERSTGGLVLQTAFDCGLPMLPALRRVPGFVF